MPLKNLPKMEEKNNNLKIHLLHLVAIFFLVETVKVQASIINRCQW